MQNDWFLNGITMSSEEFDTSVASIRDEFRLCSTVKSRTNYVVMHIDKILPCWAYAYYHISGDGYSGFKKSLLKDVIGDPSLEADVLEGIRRATDVSGDRFGDWFFSHCWLYDGRLYNGQRNEGEVRRGSTSRMIYAALRFVASSETFENFVAESSVRYPQFGCLWANEYARNEFTSCLSPDGLAENPVIQETITAYKNSESFRRAIDLEWVLDGRQHSLGIGLKVEIESFVDTNISNFSIRCSCEGVPSFSRPVLEGRFVYFPIQDFIDHGMQSFDGARFELMDGEKHSVKRIELGETDIRYAYSMLFQTLKKGSRASIVFKDTLSDFMPLVVTWGTRNNRNEVQSLGLDRNIWIVGTNVELCSCDGYRPMSQFPSVGAVLHSLELSAEDQEFRLFGVSFNYHRAAGVYTYPDEPLDNPIRLRDEAGAQWISFSGKRYRILRNGEEIRSLEPRTPSFAQTWASGYPRAVYLPQDAIAAASVYPLPQRRSCSGNAWHFEPEHVDECDVRKLKCLRGKLKIDSREFSIDVYKPFRDAFWWVQSGDRVMLCDKAQTYSDYEQIRGMRLCVTLPDEADARRRILLRTELRDGALREFSIADFASDGVSGFISERGCYEFSLSDLLADHVPDEELSGEGNDRVLVGEKHNQRTLVNIRGNCKTSALTACPSA